MAFDRSCSLVVPAADKADANRLMAGLGVGNLGDENFAARLSSSGAEPATHFGAHAWQEAAVAVVWSALPTNDGTLPTIQGVWGDFGLTDITAKAAAASLTVSVVTGGTPGGNFDATIAGLGLQRVVAVDDF